MHRGSLSWRDDPAPQGRHSFNMGDVPPCAFIVAMMALAILRFRKRLD